MLLDQNARLRQKSNLEIKTMKQKSELMLHEINKSIATIRARSLHRKTSTKNEQGFGKFRLKVLERYTCSEQTNVDFLNEELQRLRKEIQELVKFFDKRFKLRKTKDNLIEKLMVKEQTRNDLKEQGW
jgi:uncharacterized phage infection (PIP) family protein YhgE